MENETKKEVRFPGDIGKAYLDGSYLDRTLTWHVEDSAWKAKQITRMVSRNGLAPTTICEVGCGAGEILRQLSLTMPAAKYFGYELSPQAFELCKTRESENITFSLANIMNVDVSFDTLLCIDVFEHIEDYIGFLKLLKEKARHKIFHIPLDISVSSVIRGGMMTARRNVGHLHYFTPATAVATLADCGYEIVDWFYTTPFIDLPSKTIRAKIARFPRRFLYALSPDILVKYLGGCSLLVLAK